MPTPVSTSNDCTVMYIPVAESSMKLSVKLAEMDGLLILTVISWASQLNPRIDSEPLQFNVRKGDPRLIVREHVNGGVVGLLEGHVHHAQVEYNVRPFAETVEGPRRTMPMNSSGVPAS